eukprot:5304719-Prymnesium_polylepis.1
MIHASCWFGMAAHAQRGRGARRAARHQPRRGGAHRPRAGVPPPAAAVPPPGGARRHHVDPDAFFPRVSAKVAIPFRSGPAVGADAAVRMRVTDVR